MLNQTADKTNRKSFLKDLILLFAIPIGIAVFAAVVIYVPRLLANPRYDFVYSICEDYDCNYNFDIDSSGYVFLRSTDGYYGSTAALRYYSVKDDSTRIITLAEARRYQLDTSSKSPDGYSLVKEENDSGFLFWGNYKSGWYLKNGAKKKTITLTNSSSYYSRNVKFLGWVNK